ncbi:NADPH-dependent FMN reductase [Chitinophaga sp. Cy-1792]|uniref:NADPH-dependent FMN reductase n=1 Tax=Chitinophaga sp. Cy-1792 TaxID=2608339 RepID=UPI00141F3D96|nr:NAD(P)H-dependent oxidoreductase [Chitinophaga sp. Cy-1792]NIG54946.1 NAD(P)H-dependent oxidoreductase [Chitinophaga sp. Cy-1792]
MLKLKVISSTTRPGRKGPIIAKWISAVAAANPAFEVELLDLGDIHLPLMDEPFHPRLKKYEHEHTRKWSTLIDEADAFIFVTAEYNACFPAPLKNALDYLYTEWTNKPAGIVSYGGISGGTRATQLLKPVLTAFKMMPLPEGVVISMFDRFINDQEEFIADEMLNKSAGFMLMELEKWGNALKPLR